MLFPRIRCLVEPCWLYVFIISRSNPSPAEPQNDSWIRVLTSQLECFQAHVHKGLSCFLPSMHSLPSCYPILSLSLHHNRGHPMVPYETCGILRLKVSQTYLPSLCLFPPSICLCLYGRMCTRVQLVGVSSFLSSWVLGTELRSPAQEQVFFPPLCYPISLFSPPL